MPDSPPQAGPVALLRLGPELDGENLRARCEALVEVPGIRCLVLDAAGAAGAEGGGWMVVYPRPIIFAFAGAVPAGLAAVALGADIRICGPGALLALPARPSRWLRGRAARLVQSSAAMRWGETVTAHQLLATGLVSRMAADPAAEALRLAAVIADRGPLATELGKEAVWRGLEMPLEQALRFETDLTLLLQTTKDRAEGVRAFREKRTPRFTGE